MSNHVRNKILQSDVKVENGFKDIYKKLCWDNFLLGKMFFSLLNVHVQLKATPYIVNSNEYLGR